MTGVDRQLRGRGSQRGIRDLREGSDGDRHPLGDVLDFAAQPSKLRSEAEFR